jgi:hypothetical protein
MIQGIKSLVDNEQARKFLEVESVMTHLFPFGAGYLEK